MTGALDIELVTERGRADWRLTLLGGVDTAAWAAGRKPEQVAALVPRVFNLCGAAHAQAARAALDLPTPEDGARQDEVARQERLRDHAVAILADWPRIFGQEPSRDALRGIGGGEAACSSLRAALLGTELDLAEAMPPALDRWLEAGVSPTARLLARCRREIDPAWGRAELASPAMDDIAAALDAGRPTVARESTAADLWRGSPLLAALMAHEGASLFVRMVARLLDLLGCLEPSRREGEGAFAAPRGIGLARAARGLLAHRARVEDGIVTDYRVLSPSAWNLAGGGLLARMLAALPINARTPMLARLVVSCVNPCVPVRLRLGVAGEG
ncbi:nickel-dependent hydrogenase large subunit [Bosea sp. 117]|uniref:nickel-dependent hydrogenase large subunit n=1 Tax=Bosea sp. 117 TaxID=1125973 RepID=UPI000494D701|nr:nickel-dependent hydrogenase large subunit [Bosea sp. 117]